MMEVSWGFMHSRNYNWHVGMKLKYTRHYFANTETENSSISVKENYLQIKREVLHINYSFHVLCSKNKLIIIIYIGNLLQLQGNVYFVVYLLECDLFRVVTEAWVKINATLHSPSGYTHPLSGVVHFRLSSNLVGHCHRHRFVYYLQTFVCPASQGSE